MWSSNTETYWLQNFNRKFGNELHMCDISHGRAEKPSLQHRQANLAMVTDNSFHSVSFRPSHVPKTHIKVEAISSQCRLFSSIMKLSLFLEVGRSTKNNKLKYWKEYVQCNYEKIATFLVKRWLVFSQRYCHNALIEPCTKIFEKTKFPKASLASVKLRYSPSTFGSSQDWKYRLKNTDSTKKNRWK